MTRRIIHDDEHRLVLVSAFVVVAQELPMLSFFT